MSFFAAAPTTLAPDADAIANDGFFPDIDLLAMTDAMRLDGTVTQARLRPAVIAAMLTVNGELAEWKAQQQAASHATLADVPGPAVAGEAALLHHYRRAVYSLAKADLTERYRDYDATGEGHKKADALDPTIDEQRRNAHWAIADILGRARVTVELI